jgi:MFS family permease
MQRCSRPLPSAAVVGRSLRANPSLRRLLGAWAQSCLGTGAGYVALLLLTYRDLHSAWALAAVLLADFLPAIVLGAWFGALADRLPRRRLIIVANIVQAVAFIALAFAAGAPAIISLALLAGIGNALQRPALRSALPVVAGEQAQLAAALYDTCRWVGITIGPALAAGLFALSGVGLPLVLNGVSFLLAAAVVATIDIDGRGRARVAAADGDREPEGAATAGPSGLRAGLAAAFAVPGIATVILCSAGSIIAGGLLNVCEPIFATHALGGSDTDYALLVACYGIGMVVASSLVARRGDVSEQLMIRRYLAALTLTAAGMAGTAFAGSVIAAALTFAGTGYANALLLVSESQLIQARVPAAVQGRLFGSKDTVEGASFLLGLLAAGALVGVAGVRPTLGAGAAICGLCAIAGIVALRHRASATALLRASAGHAPGAAAVVRRIGPAPLALSAGAAVIVRRPGLPPGGSPLRVRAVGAARPRLAGASRAHSARR